MRLSEQCDVCYTARRPCIASESHQRIITREDLANEVHLTRQYLSQLETAACRPSLDAIVDIANTLGVSVDDLLVDSLTHSVSTADIFLCSLQRGIPFYQQVDVLYQSLFQLTHSIILLFAQIVFYKGFQ